MAPEVQPTQGQVVPVMQAQVVPLMLAPEVQPIRGRVVQGMVAQVVPLMMAPEAMLFHHTPGLNT